MNARRYPVIIEQTRTGYSTYSPDVPDARLRAIRHKKREAISRTHWLRILKRCMK
jgi:hypothetical protein